jgi:multidrug resistance efflux pump
LRWATGIAVAGVVAGAALWAGFAQPINGASDHAVATDRLIYRGYTEAPQGTVLISGEPTAGDIVIDMRIREGQEVKRDEVIAVLSNYPITVGLVRRYEAELAKAKLQREAMVAGYRVSEIAMQQLVVGSAAQKQQLRALEMKRSGQTPDQKRLELDVAEQKLDLEQARLEVLKQTLATDLGRIEADIKLLASKLENVKVQREQALVRSPVDGIVVEVHTRQGERISDKSIAKVVDMNQIRVLVDVNEVNITRIKIGQKVEVSFRGDQRLFGGKVVRIPPVVKRLQRANYDLGNPGESRVVQVEIELEEPASVPKLLGREATVAFL